MENLKEKLKSAICNNDLTFLEKNKSKYSIDERFEDEDNDTLLLYSISYSESSVYRYFLDNGANINLINDEREGIIHAIVYSGVTSRLKEILEKHKINLNSQTKDGATSLLLAISLHEYDMANVLINEGADVNISDENGITPLHMASQLGNINLVKLLIEQGANVNAKTKKGNYPLALAVNGCHDEVVKYLFKIIYNQSAR